MRGRHDRVVRVSCLGPATASAFGDRPLIETMLPKAGGVEVFADVPETTMYASEAATVEGAAVERRREFGTVRYCARRALQQVGLPPVPILPDPDGSPRWPVGVVGSLTHCAGYRAAVVARSGDLLSVGIDAEPHAPLPGAVLDLVVRDEERAWLLALAGAEPFVHWDRILFCVKEAVYKAWFPLTRRWLDFTDVSATLLPGGTFRADIRVAAPSAAGIPLTGFGGRWTVGRGLVVAATTIGCCSDTGVPALAAAA